MKSNIRARLSPLFLIGATLALAVFSFFSLPHSARADGVFNVTRFDDPAPGACDPNDCSLREAIKAANLALGGTINLPSGTYTLDIAGANEDQNATGDLDINSSITINGEPNVATVATITGVAGWSDRIFHVLGGFTVNMNNVIIQFGNTDFWGGGIYNYGGFVNLTDCSFFDNDAVAGGAIMNDNGGVLTITHGTINFNHASSNGGGVYVGSNTIANIHDSTFFSNNNSGVVNWGEVIVVNTKFQTNGGGWGAGLSNSGIATISQSQFISNIASITGGGVSNNGEAAQMTIQSSTFISNTAVSSGGAVTNAGVMSLSQSEIRGNESDNTAGGVGNSGHLTANQITVEDNHAPGIYQVGGGIHNSGFLTLTNSAVTNNLAQSGWGGGLLNSATGTANLSAIEFSGNQASKGGGLYNVGVMTMTMGTVWDNTAFNASDSGGGVFNAHDLTLMATAVLTNSANGQGGGIFNGLDPFATSPGSLIVTQSLVAGNTAVNSHGGGIAVLTGTLSLENSTLSGNSTTRHGGGLYNSTGAVTLNSVTIADNTADSSQLNLGNGGGFFTQGGAFTLVNSLIAANSDGSNQSPDCSGAPTSQGYNLVQSTLGCGFIAATGDVTGQNAHLEPLADNGGVTFTHALLGNSPAIDAANPAAPGSALACPTVDQRGAPRPVDGNDDGAARCDIGAYESGPIIHYIYLPFTIR